MISHIVAPVGQDPDCNWEGMMADHRVPVSDGLVTEILDLIDSVGPINEWRARAVDIFGPNQSGNFTNQANAVVGRGCGVTPCFVLDRFDIDTVNVGDQGAGTLNYVGLTLQAGPIDWVALT